MNDETQSRNQEQIKIAKGRGTSNFRDLIERFTSASQNRSADHLMQFIAGHRFTTQMMTGGGLLPLMTTD
jgi:hypothetical protein